MKTWIGKRITMRSHFAAMLTVCLLLAANAASATDLAGIDIHGFISQGFLWSDDNNYLGTSSDGSFEFNEVGITFGKELTDNLRIGIQFFSRDLGAIGDNDVIIDWAYGDYRWQDWLGFRAGILRQAHGFYNETRDVDMLRTHILLPQSVYAESGRDFVGRDFISRLQGGSIYGNIPLSRAGGLSYMFMAGTKNIETDSAAAVWTESSGMFTVKDFDVGIFYNGSLQWFTPVSGLRFGVSATKSTDIQVDLEMSPAMGGGPLLNDITEYYSYVVSAEYTWENLVISAEYMKHKKASELFGFPAPPHIVYPVGYYAGASYRFTDWFEMGAYYSEFYYNDDDQDGERFEMIGRPDYLAWQKDIALSTRFDINANWTIKLEGHLMDGATQLLSQENPEGFDEEWSFFAAKATFSF